MSSVLRPLRLGEILDQTAQLYRRNFVLFAGTAVIPHAVIFGVYIVIFLVAGVPLFIRSANSPPNPAFGVLFFVLMVIAIPFLLVATVFSQAGITRASVNAFRGERMKVREALASVKLRFWRFLGLICLQGLLIFGIPVIFATILAVGIFLIPGVAGGAMAVLAGLLVFSVVTAVIVAMVILTTMFGMGMTVCVVEDTTATEALKRARKLSKGTRGRIFVMFLVVWCIAMALSMIGYIPTVILAGVTAAAGHNNQSTAAAMVVLQIINMLLNLCLQTLVSPAYIVALVIFYFDQRVRIEGYDIEWMMQQAGLSTPVSEMAPSAIVGISTAEASPAPAQEQ